ncbi:hypothetical protein QFZ37_002794 [Chryseobacterium ginsenosidimutans]|nr:hypothetical protein [Chryseobacterium ginsenosidimutans]MDQ0594425.1 hypothetical protein [Chryseobacterium ginsenosidimutans]
MVIILPKDKKYTLFKNIKPLPNDGNGFVYKAFNKINIIDE